MLPKSLGNVPKEFVSEYLGNISKVIPPVDGGKRSHVLRLDVRDWAHNDFFFHLMKEVNLGYVFFLYST